MKKQILISILFIFTFLKSFAQIPNNSFENWSTTYDLAPDHYISSDIWNSVSDPTYSVAHPIGVTQYTPANSGSYAVKLQNVSGKYNNTITIDTVPSQIISSENRSDLYANYGFPFSQRPVALTGYYQFFQGSTSKKIDTGFVDILFTKWNTVTNQTDTIGGTSYSFYVTQSTYKQFSANVIYISSTIPDTAIILCSSGTLGSIASPNTYLILDDLAFTGITTATKTPDYLNGLPPSLYPNPASSSVTISNLVINSNSVQISDLAGKKVKTITVTGDMVHFNTEGMQPGMYIYSLLDGSNSVLYTNRFVVN